MNYVSFLFLFYVTAVITLYFLFPVLLKRFAKYQWTVLLAASWGFYAICGGKYLLFVLITSASIYLGAQGIQRLSEDQKRALSGEKERKEKKRIRQYFSKKKKRILLAVLLLNFGILAFFKYIPDMVNALMQGKGSFSLLVPVGLSFYTFQATGYLIDVYNGNVPAEKSFWKTALFVCFFPQIIQGPISFWDPVAGQLFAQHRPDWTRFKYGLELILWGYLRKMVLADRIVKDIYLVTDSYLQYSGSMIAVAVLLYAVQLYADFAGGIDISRGIAQILGIDLPENFRQPYLATSINDYWRRWHITLGAWMKKYVFYPLALTPAFVEAGKKTAAGRFGKTAFGKHVSRVLPASLSCIVVFLIVGIWHGAGGKYVAFGLWNGGIIFLSMVLEPFFPVWKRALRIRNGAVWYRGFQILRTFLLVFIGYVFDVAQNFQAAMGMILRMMSHFQWNPRLLYNEINNAYAGFNTWNVLIVTGMTLLMVIVDLYHEKHDRHLGGDGVCLRKRIDRGSFWKEWGLLLLAVCTVVLLGVYGPGYDPVKFVYANF